MRRSEHAAGKDYLLLTILAAPLLLLLFTIDRYYGYYYDNKFFNLLALDIWEHFRVYLYLGSHYHVPSSLFSYLAYPFFLLFGPGDFALEILATLFHMATVYCSFRLGERFHGRALGLLFALFVGLAPIHLIQVYTLPDLSFAIFLNVSGVYCFLAGLEDLSRPKLALGAVLYSLGCFQAIYSLLLFPFFIFYFLVFLLKTTAVPGCGLQNGRGPGGKVFTALLFLAALPAYTYIYLLFKFTFMHSVRSALLMIFAPAVFLTAAWLRRPFMKGQAEYPLLFILVTAALLSYFDLIVQVDYFFFDHSLGYFLDATKAGGYGGRPPVRYMGSELFIYGVPIYMSVLTSVYEFAGSNFAKSTLSLDAMVNLYSGYFSISFPSSVKVFFFAGLFGLCAGTVKRFFSGDNSPLLYHYPIVWLAAATSPFIDLGPEYYNIRRVYILPLPYLFAAFGVFFTGGVVSSIAKNINRRLVKVKVAGAVTVALALLVTADQMQFSVKNIFFKYAHDKETSMFFRLFYGHYYGRSYKEVGDFLLRDMPPQKDGAVNSLFIYSIPEDAFSRQDGTFYGRAMPLFNTVNWYTNNRIKTLCDFKDKSVELYGTPERLVNYLESFFGPDPNIKVIYMADYVDEDNENFSVFSRLFPRLKPYAVVADDGVKRFDCQLFKFERETWKAALKEEGYVR